MKAFYLLLFLLFCALAASSQTLRGSVTDKHTGQPLAGAHIVLIFLQQVQGTTTDSLGKFGAEGLLPGRYQIRISHLGYTVWQAEELLIQRGKQTVLQAELESLFSPLEEVEVRSEAGVERAAALGTHGFSTEQTQRFAAAYYDPARLATSFPGVVPTDDQANHLSIRGNSPAGMLWRLEGVNVVNPNHLANAGMFTDRAAPTGGGVNLLSAQMLSDSRLLTGNFPAGYSNTTAGVMDMRLRKGNTQKREHTLQASLLGIDLATEGPITEKSESAYLVNYRYSTVGLLSAAGVSFGNEQIAYQDLSFHLAVPGTKAGSLTLFGLGGTSRNDFTSPADQNQWKTDKDRYHVKYSSEMAALGATHELHLFGRLRWQSALAVSHLENNRSDLLNLIMAGPHPPSTSDRQQDRLLSWRTGVSLPLHERFKLGAGVVTDHQQTAVHNTGGLTTLLDSRLINHLWQPYLNAGWQPHQKLNLQLGLQHLYSTQISRSQLQPQASLQYRPWAGHSVSVSAGRYGQLPPFMLLLAKQAQAALHPRNPDFIYSDQAALGYLAHRANGWRLKTELYWQQLSRVPVSTDPDRTFSAVNYLNEQVTESWQSTGRGRNFGLEVLVEKPLANHYYLLLGGTAFRSLYTPADGRERSTRFDSRFAAAATAGKEWHWQNAAGKFREAGVHLRTTFRGGLRDMPIDLERSLLLNNHFYDQRQAYAEQLPNYFRLDLRLSLRTNRTRSTRLWYLDIQNATAYRNVAYYYFDPHLQSIQTRYQLGIIPVLGYRVEF